MRKDKNKELTRGNAFIAIIGIVFLIAAICSTISTYQFSQSAEKVVGVITHISEDNIVFVSYTVQGEEYVDIKLNEYSSSMDEGDKILLLCDPKEHDKAKANSTLYFFPIALVMLGSITLFIGGTHLVQSAKAKKMKKQLLETGYVVQAKVERIEQRRKIRINGRSPYVIICTYKDAYSGKEYSFISENLWTEPSAVFPKGAFIDVYVDENDYNRYYVAAQDALDKKIVDFT